MRDTRSDETRTMEGTPVWACDYYTIEQADESDPDPVFHDEAETVGEAFYKLHVRLMTRYGRSCAFEVCTFDNDGVKFHVIYSDEIIGTADTYELRA